MSAYGSFDQPTYKIDLTPFVPILADGNSHNITLDVVSAESDHGILSNWFLSGNIQVITDSSFQPTTGGILSYSAPLFATSNTTGSVTPRPDGTKDVNITVSASHKVEILSKIITGSGKTTLVQWNQDLSFSNRQSYTQNATYQVRCIWWTACDQTTNLVYRQVVEQTSFGTSLSTHDGVPMVKDESEYPLVIHFRDMSHGNTTSCMDSWRFS